MSDRWWETDPATQQGVTPKDQPAAGERFWEPDQPRTAGRSIYDILTDPENLKKLWPVKMATEVGKAAIAGVTAPGRAYRGELDPLSEQATKEMTEAAMLMSPTNPAYRLGSRYGAPPIPARTPGEHAAVTSGELGAPLPRGYTGNMLQQNLTQAARGLPFAGHLIDRPIAATRQAAGEAVGRVAGELGEAGRFQLGGNMRGRFDDMVNANRSAIDESYSGVRSMIDPDATFVPRHTQAVYEKVLRERMAARQENPMAGLGQVDNMVNQGISFNGLVRAKNDLAQTTDFAGTHVGLSNADRKLIGAAMKRDLHEHVTHAVLPEVGRGRALTAIQEAERQAAVLINQNKELRSLTDRTDEGLAATLIGAGREKTGDVQLLHRLRSTLPREQFNQIAGATLHELGYNTNLGQFTLDQFASNWAKMSNEGKAALFNPQHRRFLDDIGQLGQFVKQAELEMNRSRTGRATGLLALVLSAGPAASAAWHGDLTHLLGLGGSAAGGWALAAAMARPEIAAATARFARTAIRYDRHPNAATLGALRLSTVDAMRMLREDKTLSPPEMFRATIGPDRSEGGPHYPAPAEREEPLPFDPSRM